ncbi:SUKH-4 family immunity protein [Streptomyces bungoensis]|uniref:SUKH-4 family immunity protein n=1 Tax=Streptomyces bungoensis TaxID=285568 RepID=UPI00342B090C
MVTFAQAQERAEEWINGDVPAYQHREVRVREFELGFVVWGEDRAEGPRSDAGGQRLVIARDSGEATLWPALPVGEVIRRYEEEYGRGDEVEDAVPAPAAARVDLNQTSFLLSPPEWLQEAADKLGIPDRRPGAADAGAGAGTGAAASGGLAGSSADGAGGAGGPGSGASWPAPGVAGPGAGAAAQAGVPAAGGAGSGASWPAADAGAGSGAGVAASDGLARSSADGAGGAGGPGSGASWPAPGVAGPGAGVAAQAGVPAADGAGSGASWPAADAGVAVSGGLAPTQAGVPVGADAGGGEEPRDRVPAPEVPAGATPWAGTDTNADAGEDRSVPLPETVFAPPLSDRDGVPPRPPAAADAKTALMSGGSQLPPTAVAPALDTPQGGTQPPPPSGAPSYGYPAPPPAAPGTPPPGAPSYGYPPAPGAPAAPHAPQPPAGPAVPGRSLAPNAGEIADAATSKAAPPPRKGRGGLGAPPPPPPPGAPGVPGGRPAGPPAPPAPPGGYVPTQLVSSLGPEGPEGTGGPGAPQPPAAPGVPGGTPPGNAFHHAATMFADPGQQAPQPPGVPGAPFAQGAPGMPPVPGAPQPPAGPGAPQPPGVPGAPGGGSGGVHHAETVLAAPPVAGPGVPPPPAPGMPPGAPGVPGAPQPMPPGAMPPPGVPVAGQPPAYGYPQQGQPTVGPGYQAVLRYRAQDGSEQQLIRRSAPGTPHPEWQIFHELRAMNVPPDQVLELHTELESCELPGAYCARMIREQWPQARIASIAPYGTDHASRQQGMQQLLAHQGELHQVADGPARPAPVRAPLPPVQAAPPVPPEAIGQELAAVFGPGVFRFEQQAVSRQGVPPIVAHTLVVAGLPVDLGPFFWAQAQPGRPVPTLAELAAERGVQPAPDAGSYLVMGTDFGKAVCVQYGTANIVAVPVEAGPGGGPVPPQFVNTGLPEFARCLALLGRMWRLRHGLNQEQAGRWTVDFQAQLASLDPAALGSPESWWSVLLEQMWDGLL